MAKNAAIVSVSTSYASSNQKAPAKMDFANDNAFNHYSDRTWEDTALVYNYVNEMIDDIHYQGSLILFAGNTGNPGGRTSDEVGRLVRSAGGGTAPGGAGGGAPGGAAGQGPGGPSGGAAPGGMPGGMPGTPAMTDDEILADAKGYENKGYDVYQLRSTSLEVAKKVRDATNLILLARYNGGANVDLFTAKPVPSQPTDAELEKAVEQARKLEGVVDILWIRVDEHPNAWSQDKGRPKALAYAEAIKKAGIKIITCPSGGFHNPLENDEFIASGKTDMVGMTAPFFADPELVRKLKEGRADDVVPCLGCQICHGISMINPPWYATCTVNPTWGLPPYQLKGFTKPAISKKVAVIGGGPAGMKAALIAAERGHKVTMYEKDATLGGLLKISDESKWRWNYKDLKEFFIHQVNKAGINVKLNTAATPETIKAAKYDAVMVATGSDLAESEWKTDGVKVFSILDAYFKKDKLGKNVVIIGAGKFGMELAAGMLKDGHKVTVIASAQGLLAPETLSHDMEKPEAIYRSSSDFSSVLGAKVKDISEGKVTYTDSKGEEKSVQADSIVIWPGLRPRMDEAQKFIGSADDVLFLGGCTGTNGTVQKTIRSAFFVASQV
jgi:thioredoxin reductase